MINSISSNGIKPVTYARTDKSNDDEIKVLRQQESAIQKQIDSIKNGSADSKTKQELIKPLEAQIQNIEAQIQQAQVDQIGSKNDISSNSSSKNESESNVKFSKDNMFLSMSNTYKQVKEVNSVRNGLEGKANELNSDASFDEMTGNYRMAKIERVEASEDKGKANGLKSKVGKLSRDMDKSIKSEANKENKIENIRTSDPDNSDKDFGENSEKISEKNLKGDFQNEFDSNKKQSIDVLA